MEKKLITDEHTSILARYGIRDLPIDVCCLHFKPGEAFRKEGMPIQFLCIVISGQAKVCHTASSGKNLVLCYFVSEGVIGDIEFVTDSYIATAEVIAVTDVVCIGIPYYRNAQALKGNVEFMNQIAKELAKKLLVSSNNFSSAALCTGEERLCSYILQSTQHEIFHDILTDVACSVGMSYRHMFRILNQLCKDGVLEKQVYGYKVIDRERLEKKSFVS